MERINNPEALVGKKCKGFRFVEDRPGFAIEMEAYIGEVGIIKEYRAHNNSFQISFPDDYWNYPANEQVFDNLID